MIKDKLVAMITMFVRLKNIIAINKCVWLFVSIYMQNLMEYR